MTQAIIIKGRLVDSRHVELDEPVSSAGSEVQVIVRPHAVQAGTRTLTEFLDALPPGTRSAQDILKQIDEERDSWGDR